VLILAFDIFIIGRRPHEPSMREAADRRSDLCRARGRLRDRRPGAFPVPGTRPSSSPAGSTEYSLSIDNLFIFLIIMSSLKVRGSCSSSP
jgi:tellurite resistance protein TerC